MTEVQEVPSFKMLAQVMEKTKGRTIIRVSSIRNLELRSQVHECLNFLGWTRKESPEGPYWTAPQRP